MKTRIRASLSKEIELNSGFHEICSHMANRLYQIYNYLKKQIRIKYFKTGFYFLPFFMLVSMDHLAQPIPKIFSIKKYLNLSMGKTVRGRYNDMLIAHQIK